MADDKPAAGPATAAIERIRETAKWLIAAFGALGSALIASLQLQDIGELSGREEVLALVGFGLGIVGVLVALVTTATVLAAARVSIDDLEDPDSRLSRYVREATDLLGGAGSTADVLTEYREASRLRQEAYRKQLDAVYDRPDEDVADEAAREYEYAVRRIELVNPVVEGILDAGLFDIVRRHWRRRTIPGIVGGVLLAVGGMGLFATTVTEKPPEAQEAVTPTPVRGVLDLSAEGDAELGQTLGASCERDAIAVVVLSSSDKGTQVVTADARCATRRLTLSEDDGAVVSCERPDVDPVLPPSVAPPTTPPCRSWAGI
jgi:hypothetical protein